MGSDQPSALLLAVADEVGAAARAAGLHLAAYVEELTPSELAVLAVGRAARRVNPFSPVRDEEIDALRARRSLQEEVLPVLFASRATAGWSDDLDPKSQTWIDVDDEGPPRRELFSYELTRFPALATKPLGGLWTSTRLPELASVWLTAEPADWGTPPPLARAWQLHPEGGRLVRCYELGSRGDWVALCQAFPEDSTAFYGPHLRSSLLQWEPPFLTPDWSAVQKAFDAVHLQWSGFINASNEVLPVLNGTTCLCGWGSESTRWLNWVPGEWSLVETLAG